MSFFKTAYETTVGKASDIRRLQTMLKEVLVKTDRLPTLGISPSGEWQVGFITGKSSDEATLPGFVHPMQVDMGPGKRYLLADVRLFSRIKSYEFSEAEFEQSVTNKTEFDLVKTRAELNLLWVNNERERIRSRFAFAARAFSMWISQALTRSYSLDYEVQAKVQALAYYYYSSLFYEEAKLTGDTLNIVVSHSIKLTKMPSAYIYELLENLPEIKGVDGFCEVLKQSAGTTRLSGLDGALLLSMLANSWYGTHAKDLIGVCIEHPPTWITIVYAALTERTFKSSGITKMLESLSKRSEADEFIGNVEVMKRQGASLAQESSVMVKPVFPEFV